MGISRSWQMLTASCNSGAKSSSVAPSRLCAESTSRRPTVTQQPEDLLSHIRLQSIQSQDHVLLSLESLFEPLPLCQTHCQQLFITVELIGHTALGNLEPSSQQLLMDLGDTTLFSIAQCPDQGDHV